MLAAPPAPIRAVQYSMNFFKEGKRDVVAVEILMTSGARRTTLKQWHAAGSAPSPMTISSFATFGPHQATLNFTHPNPSTWVTSGLYGQLEVDYTFPVDLSAKEIEVGGPAFLLYVVEHQRERCQLQVLLPPEWRVRTNLRVHGHPSSHTFEAKNFAELVRAHIALERVPARNP